MDYSNGSNAVKAKTMTQYLYKSNHLHSLDTNTAFDDKSPTICGKNHHTR